MDPKAPVDAMTLTAAASILTHKTVPVLMQPQALLNRAVLPRIVEFQSMESVLKGTTAAAVLASASAPAIQHEECLDGQSRYQRSTAVMMSGAAENVKKVHLRMAMGEDAAECSTAVRRDDVHVGCRRPGYGQGRQQQQQQQVGRSNSSAESADGWAFASDLSAAKATQQVLCDSHADHNDHTASFTTHIASTTTITPAAKADPYHSNGSKDKDKDNCDDHESQEDTSWTDHYVALHTSYRDRLAHLHFQLCTDTHDLLLAHRHAIQQLQAQILRAVGGLEPFLSDVVQDRMAPGMDMDLTRQRDCCRQIGGAIQRELKRGMLTIQSREDEFEGIRVVGSKDGGEEEEEKYDSGDDDDDDEKDEGQDDRGMDSEWMLFGWTTLQKPFESWRDVSLAKRKLYEQEGEAEEGDKKEKDEEERSKEKDEVERMAVNDDKITVEPQPVLDITLGPLTRMVDTQDRFQLLGCSHGNTPIHGQPAITSTTATTRDDDQDSRKASSRNASTSPSSFAARFFGLIDARQRVVQDPAHMTGVTMNVVIMGRQPWLWNALPHLTAIVSLAMGPSIMTMVVVA
ncbi:hypothetical protein EDD11_006216 [Mortierella claussenii]|nr:hypothetical protein EDD11_006216 [Mortierella claussenii]